MVTGKLLVVPCVGRVSLAGLLNEESTPGEAEMTMPEVLTYQWEDEGGTWTEYNEDVQELLRKNQAPPSTN